MLKNLTLIVSLFALTSSLWADERLGYDLEARVEMKVLVARARKVLSREDPKASIQRFIQSVDTSGKVVLAPPTEYPKVKLKISPMNDRRAVGWLGFGIKIWYQPDAATDGRFVLQQTLARSVGGEMKSVHHTLSLASDGVPDDPRGVLVMDGSNHWPDGGDAEVLVFVVAYPVNGDKPRILAVASQVISTSGTGVGRRTPNGELLE